MSGVLVPVIFFQSVAADDNSAVELLKVKLNAVIKIVQDNDLVQQKETARLLISFHPSLISP
jgi:hypothetical protein